MNSTTKIGLVILGIGIILFIVGACTFTYRGDAWRELVTIGELSLMLFIPTGLIGFILIIIGHTKGKPK